MPALYILKRGLTAIRSASDDLVAFNSVDMSGKSTLIDSRILHVDHIRDYTVRMLEDVQLTMDRLLFYHPSFQMDDDEFVHEEPRSLSPSYGFVDDKRNKWTKSRTVLEYIFTTPRLCEQFTYFDGRGNIRWKPSACHCRMVEIYQLQMKLFILTLLTFGSPGRGTELLSHLIRNVAGGSVRNVFVLFNIFCLRGSFNKTTHLTLHDRAMVRVPLMRVGRLWIRFLAYLRPVYEEWQYVFRPDMHFNARHFLFAGLYRPVETVDVSRLLSAEFNREFGIKMSLGRYRQWMAFMVSCNSRIFDAVQHGTRATDDQFGHSRGMNMDFYGADLRFPAGLDRSLYMETARSSASAQLMFGHGPGLLQALCAGSEWQNDVIGIIRRVMDGNQGDVEESFDGRGEMTVGATAMVAIGKRLAKTVKDEVVQELMLHINRSLSQAHAATINLLAPNQTFDHSGRLPQIATRLTHPYLVNRLRDFMGKGVRNLGFTGTCQAEVAQLLYDGQKNVGYFAATGE
jgi:hypothetical protein